MPTEFENLNIHEKLLKIADMAGVLQKTKDGFNYRYVPEEEIQAKITAGMQKYGVMLYPSLTPGTLSVTPYHYEKVKGGKTIPVNEVIVNSEVTYTWVNADKPSETVQCSWAYIGQMEDASQAFGAGATYGNRYYLLKALQLATTEDDPDNYRSKQKQAEQYEDEKKQKEEAEILAKAVKGVVTKGTALIKKGMTKEQMMELVAKHNNGNGNPSSIKSLEICEAVMKEFEAISKKK